MDNEKDATKQAGKYFSADSDGEIPRNPEVEDFFKRLNCQMRWPTPHQDATAAALHAVQQLDFEAAAENVMNPTAGPDRKVCSSCGSQNRAANKFCAMCGTSLGENQKEEAGESQVARHVDSNSPDAANNDSQHHYHHHYHYFIQGELGGQETNFRPAAGERPVKDVTPMRAPLGGAAMSRAEVTVRKQTQDWALACNTKQLDDLLDLYAADALVLRPNTPPVRGSTAIREFFFCALESGLGEVELEPLRVDVAGDIAYEAGRCKMLAPGVGTRREERGKYLIIYSRRGGDWKVVADSWSSDLTLNVAAEPELARNNPAQPRPGPPRKSA
ncbi:MAG: hypothetical protein DMG71_14790 [Acidobacteria bacterium]|nr:MAG: hypothetical protein DMG71_14790 [Acidobacteriota bacterium]